MQTETIREPTFRELIEARSLLSVIVIGQRGGFVIAAQCGLTRRFLSSARGAVRVFPNLTTLAAFLMKLGVSRFEVETGNYELARVRPARPDRAEALRGTRSKPKQTKFFENET